MKVVVRYFAAAREATGQENETVDLADGRTVADLLALLAARHPGLAATAPAMRFAMDEQFVGPQAPLRDGAEIALIPPVGGG